MIISNDKVVTIDYSLTDEEGELIDSSVGEEPLIYLHGHHGIIPGLEQALAGHRTGDKVEVSIPPEEGYGDWDEDLVEVVAKEDFDDPEDLEIGTQFETETDEGARLATVIDIEGEDVTVDLNHPLAGMTLNFDVTVLDVRDATAEELAHGHVHGEHGHEH
ncbi:peptidylprolyl isomerase [Acidithiobacillus thiooxidans]|jgi:FKBP-type peptidyl-prolyl cis-trans isomerase SlyD|uniref:Peptidyl-prolyl cis-trans isomerase n=2 Tax=Acidithiobacillus TaxID=119977 RepID=A0A543Q0K0_ACITH|nr:MULTISPECIES: peptidylprolyl isomerase [Acidithiobacillus]MBU2739191.1 peptidylprolyl isomerase [Acidithiobacillus concretivorus]MBU2838193.1 peptidylprolyl isomerase [Acidithiobacillus thiooxidans]MDR7928152.1 peptidylprolyl isomerase [Acidithiobacillus thiooxidans]MDX5933438.1 peptidylprolyl isomerase [Acidithiobacillus thiooxidans]TQN49852.1 FKBP-type peptidyl-prolyl cis-trans isomerase SlyD [Acidithiobacillus thiooxidans ATCC 19377]